MRKAFLLLFTIILSSILLLSFAGCANNEPCEGEVIKKEFLEEYTTMITQTTMIWTGKTCVPIMTPIYYHYPDRWRITVQWYADESYHEREIFVTKECYEFVNIGDWFIYDEEFCSYIEPCEKSRK